jgi:hypothetical protein
VSVFEILLRILPSMLTFPSKAMLTLDIFCVNHIHFWRI